MRLLGSLDLDGNQMVDYLEFIAATMKGVSVGLSDTEIQENMKQAFKHFDSEGTGFITPTDLRTVLQENHSGYLSPEALDEIIAEVDTNKDGKIDYKEFCNMIMPQRWGMEV